MISNAGRIVRSAKEKACLRRRRECRARWVLQLPELGKYRRRYISVVREKFKFREVRFTNYGKSFNPGNDSFKEYGAGSKGRTGARRKVGVSKHTVWVGVSKSMPTMASLLQSITIGAAFGERPGRAVDAILCQVFSLSR
ncbi:hypothetical protein ACFX13_018266 [Malus domestica]